MIYQFEEIEVQTQKRRILVNGQEQSAQPRVFDLLVYLLENRDRAVSKQELQTQLWPSMEVTETALTRAVMKARKIIQDEGQMIKTIHGHGYHFVAPVTVSEAEAESSPKSRITQPKFAVLMLVVLLAVMASAVVVLLPDRNQGLSIAVLPVIDDTGDPDMSWTSLGLMSLALQIIQSESSIKTVSGRTSAKITDDISARQLPLNSDRLAAVQNITEATHHLVTRLTQADNNQFQLEYVIHHPEGQTQNQVKVGTDPTALLEQAIKSVSQQLGGRRAIDARHIVSDNTFVNELYARGMAWQIKGNASKARDYFLLVKEEEPTLFWARYELALTARMLGQFDQSEQELLALLAELPELTDDPKAKIAVYNGLGLAKQLQQDEPAAIEHLKQAYQVAGTAEMPELESLIAGNIALSYKRMSQYEEAKKWLARAQLIMQRHQLEDNGQITYQLAQLERDSGNNEKALVLFDEAIRIYQSQDMTLNVAAGESSKSRILGRQGQWTQAIELQLQALAKRLEINHPMGIIDSQLSLIGLYASADQFSAAEALFDDTRQRIETLDNQSRLQYLQQEAANLAWHQGKPAEVLHLLNEMGDHDSNRTMRNMRLKSLWLTGDPQPLQDHLSEHTVSLADAKPFDLLDFRDLKAFAAVQANAADADKHLLQAAGQAHQMGMYAEAAKHRLSLAHWHLNQGAVEQASSALEPLAFYDLDWWELDLAQARILAAQGQQQQALQLAQQAKDNSQEGWQAEHEGYWQAMQ